MNCMGYFTCDNNCGNKAAVIVIISMQSLVSIEQQSPRRPCDICPIYSGRGMGGNVHTVVPQKEKTILFPFGHFKWTHHALKDR